MVRRSGRDRIYAWVESARAPARVCRKPRPRVPRTRASSRSPSLAIIDVFPDREIPPSLFTSFIPSLSLVKDESFNISSRRANRIANTPVLFALAAERNTKYVLGVSGLPTATTRLRLLNVEIHDSSAERISRPRALLILFSFFFFFPSLSLFSSSVKRN